MWPRDGGLADFLLHLAVLAAALLFVVPAHVVPGAFVAGFIVWAAGLALDLRSTRSMFDIDPREESNPFFKRAVPRLGFRRAACAFVAGVEFPVLIVVSFTLIRFAGFYFLGEASALGCLSTGATVLGAAHLLAWTKNRAFVTSHKSHSPHKAKFSKQTGAEV